MINTVIFDLDGTLLDRHTSLVDFVNDQYERMISDLNLVSQETFCNRFIELDQRGYVWKDKVYQELIKEFELPFEWEHLLADYNRSFSSFATPFPNAIELLESLMNKGFKLGMITNGLGDFQTSNIQALGIEKYFDVILISEIEGLRKPDPAIFMRASDRLNADPMECVYVGDHPINDVTASRAVGMKGIWKEDKYYSDPFEYDASVQDLKEIEFIIDQWNREAELIV